MSEEKEIVSVEDSIRSALDEIESKEAEKTDGELEPNPKSQRTRNEEGKFVKEPKKKPEKEAVEVKEEEAPAPETPAEPKKPKYEAPQSYRAAVKEKWDTLPDEFKEEIIKRETDIHQALTRHDGDLKMGRELKEVITPYMPIIQAEGGTPAKAVQELLNTAYQLRTGSPQVKAQLVQNIIQAYGVDASLIGQAPQNQADPVMQQLMSEVANIKNTITQQTTLQEQQKFDSMVAEIKAFSAKPENEHFETIRPDLAPYLSAAEAKNPNRPFQEILQEAYTAAIWSNSTIRASLIAKQEAQARADADKKRKEEVTRKKQAAVSVTGSPGANAPASPKSQKSINDELSEIYDQLVG